MFNKLCDQLTTDNHWPCLPLCRCCLQVLPADVRQLWELLRDAVLHYCRPANLGAGFQAARRQAAKDMFAFAQQLEQRGYPDYLFTWNLHWAVCQLPVQEEARGSAAASAEWWTERLMQTYKNLVGGRVTHGSEQVRRGRLLVGLVNGWFMQCRFLQLRAAWQLLSQEAH